MVRKEDLEKLVSDRLKEAMAGTIGGDREGAVERMREAIGGLKVGKDGILEGMTIEVHEEPDDVKLIREVMEEPLEAIHATVTVRLPFDLKRVYVRLQESLEGPESEPPASSAAGQRPELDHEPYDK